MQNMKKCVNIFGYMAKMLDYSYWYSCCSTCISLPLLILDKHEIGFCEFRFLTAIMQFLYLGCWDSKCSQCFHSVKCLLQSRLGEKMVWDLKKIEWYKWYLSTRITYLLARLAKLTKWLNTIAAIYFFKNHLLYTFQEKIFTTYVKILISITLKSI